ncbi:MAG: peptidoglycan DD-metalloendopeptidase family protein [Fibrobacterota bacterium]
MKNRSDKSVYYSLNVPGFVRFDVKFDIIKKAAALFFFLTVFLSLAANLIINIMTVSSEAKLIAVRLLNNTFSERLEGAGKSIEFLSGSIESNFDYYSFLSASYGINPIDESIMQVGIGGPSTERETPFLSFSESFIQSSKINKLLRQHELQEHFSENADFFLKKKKFGYEHMPSIIPTTGVITSEFGYRLDPFSSRMCFHAGIDYGNKTGTPVYASANGYVKFAGEKGAYGKLVVIEHGTGIETFYAHLDKYICEPGSRVKRRELIGYSGETGKATGPHLHYEIRKNGYAVDPSNYITSVEFVVD